MKRTTIVLPDELNTLLELERQRHDLSASEIVRRALEAHFRVGSTPPKRLPFAALGRSGRRDTAREAEAILAREWQRAGGG